MHGFLRSRQPEQTADCGLFACPVFACPFCPRLRPSLEVPRMRHRASRLLEVGRDGVRGLGRGVHCERVAGTERVDQCTEIEKLKDAVLKLESEREGWQEERDRAVTERDNALGTIQQLMEDELE